MATKARQQYFADEVSLKKDNREFALESNIKQKIDSVEAGAQVNTIETVKVNGTALVPDLDKAVNVTVPEVIDNLYTVDPDDALSAKQGKLLYDYIQNISSRGRFLSNWNSATGLPMTNPSESPYPYKSGDYFVVSNIAGLGGTNYRPDGSSYIIGQASTVAETEGVDVSDFYFYDGTYWLLLKNSARSGAVDSSLSTTSTNPVENRVITNALNGKQDTLVAGTNIQIAADGKTISATDTTYSAGANISIDANNEISAVDTTYTAGTNVQISAQNVISATDTKYTAGTGINIDANNEISNTLPGAIVSATAPSNPTEGMVWYDTANDSLKAYNGTSWETEGIKMVVLEYGVSTWQDFLDAYNKNAIVYCKVSSGSSGYRMAFMAYTAGQGTPTEVEFQYYRSRSSHSTAANQLDEVYVYKLTSSGVWTTTQRDTAAKAIAGTGIGLSFNSSGMTISADTTVLATQTDLNSKQDTLVSGTNIKTVNSNSLLGSGDIVLNDVKVSATTPSSPTEGMVWYDTTNDQLKVYDGTNWNVTGKEYIAGPGIEIGTIHSDMQGPAPDGFHVPTKDEWVALCGILTSTFSMASNGTTMGTYLKMPMAGDRSYSDADGVNVGISGRYWSSTPDTNNFAYNLQFSSYIIRSNDSRYRAYGFSVRCFKDTPVIPTSSWTTLYDGSSVATGAGVFYNATDGLISVSGDGQTWYTIQDKNLGATAVFNQGDAVTNANCGYFYQRGNNGGFPHSGNVLTSNTQVDASNYGPGNYYSSNTFITQNEDWSSVQNDNLWGGASQGTWIGDGNTIINTGVLSVNGQNGAVTVSEFNPGGTATTGYVVTKTSNGYEWQAPAATGITNNTTGTTTTLSSIWVGTSAEYALITPAADVLYIVY